MTAATADMGGGRRLATAAAAAAVVAGMVGLAFASVPLYDLFCRVTGYGGTPQQADAGDGADMAPGAPVTVRFDANVARGLPWTFTAPPVTDGLRMGEEAVIAYRVRNDSGRPTSGTATFNVTPQKAGPYFMKLDCFCFTEQTLQPGQSAEMPVRFFVDPALADDADVRDVRTITLSYTFFPMEPGADAAPRP